MVVGVGLSEDEVLHIAGGVESDSEHPLARAIVTAARERGPIGSASTFRSLTGRGVEATVDGDRYAVGGPALLREQSLDEPHSLAAWSSSWKERGSAVLYLVRGTDIVGALALEDEVRPEARAAVTDLQAMGRKVVMITGDARQVADAVGADLGIPVAAGAMAWAGIAMPPAIAAVLMSVSTIVVALNAQLLRRVDLRP